MHHLMDYFMKDYKIFPQEGDKIEIEELRIVVEKVSKNIPKKIRIERIKS